MYKQACAHLLSFHISYLRYKQSLQQQKTPTTFRKAENYDLRLFMS